MLPSIDTYLYDQIETKLKIILENRYIIEEILKGVQPDIAKNFMRAYTGDTAREIPIVYTMPQDKEKQQGAIYIGLREGLESKTSIGNLEGTYAFKDTGLRKEAVTVQATENEERCYFEVTERIADLNNVEGLEFARSDNVTTDKNRIYFTYDAELVGKTFNVNYVAMAAIGDEYGLKKGFTTTEQYSVLVVSTNMNTVRCLDLILKAILILMRSNPEESTSFLLQRLQFGQIEEIPVGTEENPEMLYGRESIVTYTTSYSLDAPIIDTVLEKIILNINYELGGEQRG
ncbi:hypothetical protein CPT_Mater175 [Bacillus phage Mater]|uniref:Uncharacterized protein n=1 Tax=Bacillus phage Mater TaxID=1540090 RepID=A0A0A0RMW5_9CAUD|nr:hypothetical protein CPT_Mater175 [Bacillus phage Mater]AIW03332.1 hypothetical protein CPT_Mater175 [Bacillus phage Mater]